MVNSLTVMYSTLFALFMFAYLCAVDVVEENRGLPVYKMHYEKAPIKKGAYKTNAEKLAYLWQDD